MDSVKDPWFFTTGVSPFGDLWIDAHFRLPTAYRRLSRPSSALSAKAFTLRSSLLERPCCSLSIKKNCSFCLSLANNCWVVLKRPAFLHVLSFRLGDLSPSAHCSVPTLERPFNKLNGFSLQLSVRYFTFLIRFSMNICLPRFHGLAVRSSALEFLW